jgi:hypothetical protein
VALLCGSMAQTAMARPSASEKETARGLVRDGRVKLKRGELDEALADFRAAHEIMNVPTTGLELGKAQAKLGMWVEALDTLLAVTRKTASPGEPRAFGRARRAAKKLAEELGPRVPSVRVKLTGEAADGATVSIDGQPLSAELVGSPYKVNPGVHEVIAVADGGVEERAQVNLDEGGAREVVLHLSLPVATEPEPGGAGSEDDAGSETHPLVWVGLGLAGVGAVAGSVTGALALDKHAEVASQCPDRQCPPETHEALDTGLTLGTVSTAMFVVAGAGAVATVVGLFLPYGDPSGSASSDDGAWLRVGPTGVVFGGTM